MSYIITPINKELFKEKVAIRFDDISEGFSRFKHIILKGKTAEEAETKFIAFMGDIFDINGEEESFVDFYFSRLDKIAKEKLIERLSLDDRIILEKYTNEAKSEDIYFRLSKENIPFFMRLSISETLFSTFYFTKYPCTIWGNYDIKFPMFLMIIRF